MSEFPRVESLPSYVFSIVNKLKAEARAKGKDIIDFGMGNPDKPTPSHIIDKLIETSTKEDSHRYASSNGIPKLRSAISQWYKKRYGVDICPEEEAIVTIGSKEGLAHLALAISGPGDTILVPDPSYPIHIYGFVMTGANIRHLPMDDEHTFLTALKEAVTGSGAKPKALVINFPANPTTHCVDLVFFEKIINIAKKHNIWVIHDLAYADIAFDGYMPPSILQVEGAKDIACETFSMSKSYNMPGWRVGFVCGNKKLVGALKHLKNYLDYGTYIPIQEAATEALNGPQACVNEIRQLYQDRRNILCAGLNSIGWQVNLPKATMFLWAKIPDHYLSMGSLAFTKYLIKEANVAVAPGIGFGDFGDDHVRFSFVENEVRTREAISNLDDLFKRYGLRLGE